MAGQMGVSDGPMAGAGAGGYQAPGNAAAVSGPGALSQRTDAQPAQAMQTIKGGAYGSGTQMQQLQAGAPMAAAPSPGQPATAGSGLGPSLSRATPGTGVVPFHAPSGRPNEPVTAGAARGPGPGPEALNLPPSTNKQDYVALRPALPAMQLLANLPGSTPGIKQFVRYLQSGGLAATPTTPPPGAQAPAGPGGQQ